MTRLNERDARLYAKAARAQAKALRPWWRRKRVLIPSGVLALVIVGAVAGPPGDEAAVAGGSGIKTSSNNSAHAPQDDLHDDLECTSGPLGMIVASGTLTNNSSKISNYSIHVTFEAAGVQYAEGIDWVASVQAGVTAEWDANGFEPVREGTTCHIREVERWAS